MRLSATCMVAAMGGCACLHGAARAQWSAVFTSNGPSGNVAALLTAAAAPGEPTRLYVGGSFPDITTPAGSLASANLGAWDGQTWLPGPGMPNLVASFTVHPYNGVPTLFVGAATSAFGGYPLWRFSNNQWIGVPVGTQTWVSGIASFDIGQGPRLAISSAFFTPSEYIAQWNQDVLSGMGSGLITVTKAFAVFDDGQGPRLYAGAGANSVPGLSFVSMWDGSQWSIPGGDVHQPVHALKVFDDGTGPALYAGGDFTWVGSVAVQTQHIAKYKNGVWSAVGAGMNSAVRALEVFDDGSGPALYAAGDFATAGGIPASRIARWRGGQWSPLDAGISGGSVAALAVFDDDGAGPHMPALYAAGSFTTAGGLPSLHIARWGGTCYANCDLSPAAPVLTANDFQCFLNSFASGSPYANCDRSSAPPLLTANDFQCFLNAFALGCS